MTRAKPQTNLSVKSK